MSDAVQVRNLGKTFKRFPPRKFRTLKEAVLNGELFRSSSEAKTIEVLNDVSFSVPTGTTYGIVGRNGAGKSTLLKILAGIHKPTTGSVAVAGSLALLSLGLGFHHEFSGRENIFINGMVLGLTPRELRAKFDDIVAYAELEEFIDAPVRTYSSGMQMRLAFSVAINVAPDILLVDEVLAVGDQAFARKCIASLNQFKRNGGTIIVVTHDLMTVRAWCDEALWLDRGTVRAIGKPAEVLRQYDQAFAAAPQVASLES